MTVHCKKYYIANAFQLNSIMYYLFEIEEIESINRKLN